MRLGCIGTVLGRVHSRSNQADYGERSMYGHHKHDNRCSDGSLCLTEQVLWIRATAPFARGDSRVSMCGGFFRSFWCWIGRPRGANDIVSACVFGSLIVFVEAHSWLFSPSPLFTLAIERSGHSEWLALKIVCSGWIFKDDGFHGGRLFTRSNMLHIAGGACYSTYGRKEDGTLCWNGTTQPYRLYIVRFFSSRKSSVTTTSTGYGPGIAYSIITVTGSSLSSSVVTKAL